MFHKKTVFVLGAGFSAELGMPMGGGLAIMIREALEGRGAQNSRYCNLMESELGGKDPLKAARNLIVRSLPRAESIDNLVDHHAGDPNVALVAKHAIAKCILRAECASHIERTDDGYVFKSECEDSAASALLKLAVRGVARNRLDEAFENISFINFNYDRCLETYIYWFLRSYSAISHMEAARIVETLDIWHPYGWLGPIHNLEGDQWSVLPFATQEDDQRLLRLQPFASRLKTFSESQASDGHEEAKTWLANAEQIIFLGSAYHLQNLDLLGGPQEPGRLPRIYGTYYRPPPFDEKVNISMAEFIKANLAPLSMHLRDRLCGNRIVADHPLGPQLHGLTCRQLVEMYDHSWTMDG